MTRCKTEKAHLNALQSIGCIACRVIGHFGTPAEIHHIRSGVGTGQRSSDFQAIPLCPYHHRSGGHGEAFHAGPKIWQERFGTEGELLSLSLALLKDLEVDYV